MAYFDRFDICEAYHVFEIHWNIGGVVRERKSNDRRNNMSTGYQLHRMRFKPRPSLDGYYHNLSENGKEIYRNLITRYGFDMPDDLRVNFDNFVQAYIDAMYFTEIDETWPDNALLADEAIEEIKKDCRLFLQKAKGYLNDDNFVQAGYDFWFTRNGHGVGFWDRPEYYNDNDGQKLTEICRAIGEQWAYIGDDGMIYVTS